MAFCASFFNWAFPLILLLPSSFGVGHAAVAASGAATAASAVLFDLVPDFVPDFGGVWGARSAHFLLFGRPGDQRMHVFWKSANELDF